MLMIIVLVGVRRESTPLGMPPIPEIGYALVEVVRGQAGHKYLTALEANHTIRDNLVR